MFYIKDKVIKDFENGDYFDGAKYVFSIKEAVKINEIRAIGVYGQWGVGKTSIIKNVISELKQENVYDEKNIVEYNAWKYSEYEFMRDFLIICSKQIEGDKKALEREETYYSDSSTDSQISVMLWSKLWKFIKRSWRVLVTIVLIYILSLILIIWINSINPSLYKVADLLTPLTLLLIGFFMPLFLVNEINHKSISRKFSPEQFAREFEDIVGNRKVLIFIDDIDRCNYDEIKTTFDTLKTFILDDNFDVKFIIPVDPNVLIPKLGDTTYDYFIKIFDFPIEIKNYMDVKFEPLLNDMISEVKDEYKEMAREGLDLATKHYISTPRKLKSFANEFINKLYNLFEEKPIKNYGREFAKLTILKNEFPDYYNKYLKNPFAVENASNDMLEKYNKNTIDNKNKRGIVFSEDLLDFLAKTSAIKMDNYMLYAYGISYDEHKLKNLIEYPTEKNKLSLDSVIDLDINERFIDYRIKNTILDPIIRKSYLLDNPTEKVLFLLSELNKQKSNKVIFTIKENVLKLLEQLIIYDTNSIHDVEIDEEENTVQKQFNIEYLINSIKPYLISEKNKNNDFINDSILDKVLEIIINEAKKDKTILNSINSFLNDFSEVKEMQFDKYEKIIELIEMCLNNNFAYNVKELEWYFDTCVMSGNACFVDSFIKNTDIEFSKDKIETYFNNRYKKSRKLDQYTKAIKNNISTIVNIPDNYSYIINPYLNHVDESDTSFQICCEILDITGVYNKNSLLRRLIAKLLTLMPKTSDYDSEKYHSYIEKLGIQLNAMDNVYGEYEELLESQNTNFINAILKYDESDNTYENDNILNHYTAMFIKANAKKNFITLGRTIAKRDSFVIVDDLKKQGFKVDQYKTEIVNLVNDEINKYIYLLNVFSTIEIDTLDFSNIELTTLEYKYIESNHLLKRVKEISLIEYEQKLSSFENESNNRQFMITEFPKFIKLSEIVFGQLDFDMRKLWAGLRKIESIMYSLNLIDNIYLPTLKNSQVMLSLFKNPKYLNSYQKNNMLFDKVKRYIGF